MTEREFDTQQEPMQSTLSLDGQTAEAEQPTLRRDKKAKKDKSAKKNSVLRTTLLYVFLFLFVTGFAVGATALVAVLEVCYGPSVAARNTFVATAKETTRFKWVPHLFFSDQMVADILGKTVSNRR